jgi:hypothetical protein
MLAMILVAIPKYTKGKLQLIAKNKNGQPLKSKVEALDDARNDTPDLLGPAGTMDRASVATTTGKGAVREIKEWHAIMDHLRRPCLSPLVRRESGKPSAARELVASRASSSLRGHHADLARILASPQELRG